MIKRIAALVLVCIALFAGLYFTLTQMLPYFDNLSHLNLLLLSGYFGIASIVICLLVELAMPYIPNKTGVLFLALVFVKLGVFVMIFNENVFPEEGLVKFDKIAIFSNLFISLLIQGIFVAKLLKLNNAKFEESQQ